MTHSNWHTLTHRNTLSPAAQLMHLLEEADAILVGVGAGMSNADGFSYVGPRFQTHFADFIAQHHWLDMFQASVFPFDTLEESWAFFSRFVDLNYLSQPVGDSYVRLKALLEPYQYHIITSNADNAFEAAAFPMSRVLHVQGKYNLMQCSKGCHTTRYRNDDLIRQMLARQQQMLVPSDLIPYCPQCGAPLELNRRNHTDYMIEDEEFNQDWQRYMAFLTEHEHQKLLLLELGCGYMAPQVIKHPFQAFVATHEHSLYCTVNLKNYRIPEPTRSRTIWLNQDIAQLLIDTTDLTTDKGASSCI